MTGSSSDATRGTIVSATEPVTDFMKLSTEVVKRFIHTVVFVDDKAMFPEEGTESPGDTLSVKTPPRRALEAEPKNPLVGKKSNAHELNVKELTDIFTSHGILCSIIKPIKDENPLGNSITAAKRADIIVLDWVINDVKGKRALEIIKTIISSNPYEEQRLRLIIIYSGEKEIVQISSEIKTALGEEFDEVDDGFAFRRGHLKISIYAKSGVDVPDPYKTRVIPLEKLPDILSNEFASLTAGLVSNIAVESMSVLRDNTHLLLGCLGSEIDPPYLSHRALLPTPEDAKYLAIDIIASEFRSLLYDNKVGEKANNDVIKSWINYYKPEHDTFYIPLDNDSHRASLKDICDMEEVGLGKCKIIDDYLNSKPKASPTQNIVMTKESIERSSKSLTSAFCFNGEKCSQLEYKFAMLTSLKSKYVSPGYIPILTQGTIVEQIITKKINEHESETILKYWLCIQPRCDCERINKKRSFLFLALKKVDEESNSEFDIITEIKDDSYIRLKVSLRAYDAKMLLFKVTNTNDEEIKVKSESDGYYFNVEYSDNKDENSKFRWITELKTEHTQRIVNEFASKLIRVGLDESEWLRRNAPRTRGVE